MEGEPEECGDIRKNKQTNKTENRLFQKGAGGQQQDAETGPLESQCSRAGTQQTNAF